MCHLADPASKDGAGKPKGDAPPSPATPPPTRLCRRLTWGGTPAAL